MPNYANQFDIEALLVLLLKSIYDHWHPLYRNSRLCQFPPFEFEVIEVFLLNVLLSEKFSRNIIINSSEKCNCFLNLFRFAVASFQKRLAVSFR